MQIRIRMTAVSIAVLNVIAPLEDGDGDDEVCNGNENEMIQCGFYFGLVANALATVRPYRSLDIRVSSPIPVNPHRSSLRKSPRCVSLPSICEQQSQSQHSHDYHKTTTF